MDNVQMKSSLSKKTEKIYKDIFKLLDTLDSDMDYFIVIGLILVDSLISNYDTDERSMEEIENRLDSYFESTKATTLKAIAQDREYRRKREMM